MITINHRSPNRAALRYGSRLYKNTVPVHRPYRTAVQTWYNVSSSQCGLTVSKREAILKTVSLITRIHKIKITVPLGYTYCAPWPKACVELPGLHCHSLFRHQICNQITFLNWYFYGQTGTFQNLGTIVIKLNLDWSSHLNKFKTAIFFKMQTGLRHFSPPLLSSVLQFGLYSSWGSRFPGSTCTLCTNVLWPLNNSVFQGQPVHNVWIN
jgi:hypothetical protein